MDLIEIIKEFGPSLGIILFFLGRDAAREERLTKTIDELNSFIQQELIDLIKNEK
jgi:hypothetical protein